MHTCYASSAYLCLISATIPYYYLGIRGSKGLVPLGHGSTAKELISGLDTLWLKKAFGSCYRSRGDTMVQGDRIWRCYRVTTTRGAFTWYAPSTMALLMTLLHNPTWAEEELIGWQELDGHNPATMPVYDASTGNNGAKHTGRD